MTRKVTRRAFAQAAALSGLAASAKPYVQSVTWDGNSYTKSWFSHARIAQGGKIVLRMGAQPNEKFGAAVEDRPPSFA
jgi:putative alpha-1,2-mannosidase